MSALRRIFLRALILIIIIIPIAALAHLIVFPAEARSIFIDFSHYQKSGRIYYAPNTPPSKIDSLHILVEMASNRVSDFWGDKTSNPTIIFCETKEDFFRYSGSTIAPAVVHLKLGTYIVIGSEGFDLDIISHEIAHAELYQRVGFYNRLFKVPTWFDEGLAMQLDFREFYSEENLIIKTDSLKNLPDLKSKTLQFQAGGREQVILNYMTAKYEVGNWYTAEKLNEFIREIKAGKSFEEAYGR